MSSFMSILMLYQSNFGWGWEPGEAIPSLELYPPLLLRPALVWWRLAWAGLLLKVTMLEPGSMVALIGSSRL